MLCKQTVIIPFDLFMPTDLAERMRVWAMHDDSSDADWPAICALADGVIFDFHDAPAVL